MPPVLTRTLIRARKTAIVVDPGDPTNPTDPTNPDPQDPPPVDPPPPDPTGPYTWTSTGTLGARLEELYGGPESGSWITTKLPPDAAIMDDGGAAKDAILADMAKNTPWINRSAYCPTINVVPADQPMKYVYGDGSRFANDSALLQMLNGGVPLPADVPPGVGTDGEVVIYMPDWRASNNPESSGNPPNGALWELWKVKTPAMNSARTEPNALNQWSCAWAGRMVNANSRLSGHWRNHTFNGQGGLGNPGSPGSPYSLYEKSAWGCMATSLPLAGTTISKRDMVKGKIEHAVQFMLAGVPLANQVGFVWPAQRRDGASQVGLPQGARLRFPAGMPTPGGLNKMAQMIFEAARDYGLVFTDTASGFILRGEPGMDGQYVASGHGASFPDPLATMRSIPWASLVRLETGSDSNFTPLAA